MKTNKFLSAVLLILLSVFLVQCEKHGDKIILEDDDSDKPAWAGKDGTGENPHPSTNPSPGITKGGDYGDLYELYRTVDGVPIMLDYFGDESVYYVQPVDEFGNTLDLNEEGELLEPDLAIPVEFGRLNIVRSPPSVLDQAFDEAMKVLTGEGVDGRIILDISLDFCGRLTSEYSDDGGITSVFKTIDSPRENMAIYKHIMNNMFDADLAFLNDYEENFDPMMVAASCFAAGSDKTGTVNLDEVVYINSFMECIGDPLTAIENDNDFDPEGNERWYFNFSNCSDGLPFHYNRSAYESRYIQFLVWDDIYYPVDENGDSEGPVFQVRLFMEGLIDGQSRFTNVWGDPGAYEEYVEGFATAIDDAVQVLELVHGDSNIRFLPDYVPAPTP